jgi:phage terminase small subunit
MKAKGPKRRAPRHLRPSSKAWWTAVVRDYSLEDHHVLLLTGACEALDRAEQARETLLAEGCYFTDRHGARKPHPGLQSERDSKRLFQSLLREMGLDIAPDAPRAPLGKGY